MKNLLVIISFVISTVAFSQNNSQKIGLQIGDIAPNISLPSAQGDTIDLVSLRGQVVLIDFWASWCGPCRRENPVVVASYKEYKDKNFTIGTGFTVYSVSLDQNKSSWLTAIKRDNLTWNNHVTDYMGWYGMYTTLYNIRSIPSNFLIDKDGVIIAKNIRGEELAATLKKYLQ